jgi:pyruvate-ferredoxin/flavodoxin oxidoreductase
MDMKSLINEAWETQSIKLDSDVKIAIQDLKDMLLIEKRNTEGFKEANLNRAMGELSASQLDLSSISNVMKKTSKSKQLDSDRMARIENLHEELQKCAEMLGDYKQVRIIESNTDVDDIFFQALKHYDKMAHLFKLLRKSNLEKIAKYQHDAHDHFFEQFSWEHINDKEVALCPPFVVILEDDADRKLMYSTILPIVTSGIPIKVVLSKTTFKPGEELFGRSTALRCSFEVEMLPVALQGVYVLQDSASRRNASQQIKQSFMSPRPGLISILNMDQPIHSDQAIKSRAFPIFTYDPDRSDIFLKCFMIEENPHTDKLWFEETIEFIDEHGTRDRMSYPYTFADFINDIHTEDEQFSMLDEAHEKNAVELHHYLEMKPEERPGKIPFLIKKDKNEHLIKIVPSMSIVSQTADRQHLWESLMAMAGVNNPYVIEVEKRIRKESQKEKEKILKEMRENLDSELAEKERLAVDRAMMNLAKKLTGLSNVANLVNNTSTTLSEPDISASVPKNDVKPTPVSSNKTQSENDIAWIESESCTTCDECITINPKIFEYNSNKQAEIKDPKGGPFKDIVKAAEKCSATIIHPGTPQDPNEPDLEKWIAKAEQFQ